MASLLDLIKRVHRTPPPEPKWLVRMVMPVTSKRTKTMVSGKRCPTALALQDVFLTNKRPSCLTDEDEDWNVFDDFNNNYPTANAPIQAPGSYATGSKDFDNGMRPASTYAGSDAGYFRRSLDPFASTLGLTTASEHGLPEQCLAAGTQRNSTLLNAESFGFDVRNADPRSANVLAYGTERDGGLYPAESHVAAANDPDGNDGTNIELVTVPALGQEFSKEEMKGMSRQYKRKAKASRRKQAVSRWGKGEQKIGGWLSPRWAVVLCFFACVFLGVLLVFVVPRVPSLAFFSTNPLEAVPNSASMMTHYAPTNFR